MVNRVNGWESLHEQLLGKTFVNKLLLLILSVIGGEQFFFSDRGKETIVRYSDEGNLVS